MRLAVLVIALSALFTISCTSPKRYQTYTYDKYARKHKSIAILPVDIDGRAFNDKITEEKKLELSIREQEYITDVLFQKIIKRTGKEKKDIKIDVMSNSTVLNNLRDNKINPLDISKVENKELSKILGVDAILRVKIQSKILLHSYEDDLAKEALQLANIFLRNIIIKRVANTDLHPINVTAEIIDAESESVIWSYHKLEKLEVAEKHNDVLNDICKDIAMRMPYRENL